MKNVNTATTPKIDTRDEQQTIGIRVQTPMRGMAKVVDQITKELRQWIKQHGVQPSGPPFLRFYVIDMTGDMDIEYGVPVSAAEEAGSTEMLNGDGRVTAGVLPAGRYASLIYTGGGYQGNRTLVEWAVANGVQWDRWDDPRGDAFASRYESYLTDPKIEARKTRREVEVAIKVRDDPAQP